MLGKKTMAILLLFFSVVLNGCNMSIFNGVENVMPKAENGIYNIDVVATENKEMKDIILKLKNNTDCADVIIKTTYTDEKLLKLSNNIQELFEQFPPECVRLLEDKNLVYFVYKSNEGKYAFWMYSLEEKSGVSLQKWYCGKSLYKKQFENLKDKNATIEDVKNFDPYGSYVSLYLGSAKSLYTYHYTVDGYCLRIDYQYDNNLGAIIKDITICENYIYDNLLDIDRKLLAE